MGNPRGFTSGIEDKMPDMGFQDPAQYRQRNGRGHLRKKRPLSGRKENMDNWLPGQTRVPSEQPPITASQITAIIKGTETNKKPEHYSHCTNICIKRRKYYSPFPRIF